MCLILTIIAALAATLAWYMSVKNIRKIPGLELLTLMYWGASLMWMVDGIFSVAEGDNFFNISLNDTLLGLTVVFSGFLVWFIIFVYRARLQKKAEIEKKFIKK